MRFKIIVGKDVLLMERKLRNGEKRAARRAFVFPHAHVGTHTWTCAFHSVMSFRKLAYLS